ncbi:MAG: proteasome accessory factor PafA2 family protein [Pirellula sp.]|nr:proteasome accessory factor PafA2 family protein [Pirellula sp.]
MGLETEYSVVSSDSPNRPSFDFDGFLRQVKKIVPIAPSFRNPTKFFLANGGSFSLESGASASLTEAYLEASTPECKSPMELLESHLALQQTAIDSIRRQYPDRTVRLIQGNHDGNGHTYGQHESYEVNVANGITLLGWRIGVALLLPCVLAYRVSAVGWLTLILILAQIDSSVRAMVRYFAKRPVAKNNKQTASSMLVSSRWIGACSWGLRTLHAPLAMLLWLNIQLFALRVYRKKLTAFFVSRCIIDGAGHIDEQGLFRVSTRAYHVNCIIGFGGYSASRPIFRCDSWLKDLCVGGPFALGGALRLFRKRQRIEIAIGDSGLCQTSQYVRMGSTSLAFDLAENSRSVVLPRLNKPLDGIRRYSRDWMLLAKETGKDGAHWYASEIQNAYALAVREMIDQSRVQSFEAKRIVELWQTLLSQLELSDEKSCPSKDLVGKVDWITKLWLLHQLENKSRLNTRLKLDVRYHELSKEGYGSRVLELTGGTLLVQSTRIERACQSPPKDSPAVPRSYLIREFGEGSGLVVDWDQASWTMDGKRYRRSFPRS